MLDRRTFMAITGGTLGLLGLKQPLLASPDRVQSLLLKGIMPTVEWERAIVYHYTIGNKKDNFLFEYKNTVGEISTEGLLSNKSVRWSDGDTDLVSDLGIVIREGDCVGFIPMPVRDYKGTRLADGIIRWAQWEGVDPHLVGSGPVSFHAYFWKKWNPPDGRHYFVSNSGGHIGPRI